MGAEVMDFTSEEFGKTYRDLLVRAEVYSTRHIEFINFLNSMSDKELFIFSVARMISLISGSCPCCSELHNKNYDLESIKSKARLMINNRKQFMEEFYSDVKDKKDVS